MTTHLDDVTRARMDDDGTAPDYGLLLDVRGYRIGDTGRVRWEIIPVESSANIDVEDGNYLADVLEKVIEVLRNGETWIEPAMALEQIPTTCENVRSGVIRAVLASDLGI